MSSFASVTAIRGKDRREIAKMRAAGDFKTTHICVLIVDTPKAVRAFCVHVGHTILVLAPIG